MISRPLVLGLLAAGCVTAAAGGGYLAVRHSAVDPTVTATAALPAPEVSTGTVTETEAVIEPAAPVPEAQVASAAARPAPVEAETRPSATRREPARAPAGASSTAERPAPPRDRAPARVDPAPWPPAETAPAPAGDAAMPPSGGLGAERGGFEPVRLPEIPPAPPEPQFVEVVVAESSVIGLQVETSVSSENARIEDRVEARVTRDVTAGGRVAIPAGSRVIGSVTHVERGGKLKDRARLGVRFHTLVFADGTQMPLRTEPIFREGESASNESARKIGGATVGGAILGAIIGGGKGAAIGAGAGAAGGTAAVMAGDRNAATLPAGTVVNIRLSSPVAVEVERRQ